MSVQLGSAKSDVNKEMFIYKSISISLSKWQCLIFIDGSEILEGKTRGIVIR